MKWGSGMMNIDIPINGVYLDERTKEDTFFFLMRNYMQIFYSLPWINK